MKSIQKKLKAVLITIILCITSLVIIQNDTSTVAASEQGEDNGFILSTDLIHRVTENLSNVVYTAYDEGELRKGRAFGSKGEHAAADYIENEMNQIGLSNVHKEQITNVSDSDPIITNVRGGNGTLTTKLDLQGFSCHLNNSGTISSVDCYISPRWNDIFFVDINTICRNR